MYIFSYTRIVSTALLFSLTIFSKSVTYSIENNGIDESSNSTIIKSVFDSFVRCYVRNSEATTKTDCLKDNLYPVMDRIVRKNLDYVFTKEEKTELSKYHPVLKRVVQIMTRSSSGAPWLDSKTMNQLKSFISSESTEEGRRRRNRYQYLMYPIMLGYILVPIVYKLLAALAVKAIVIGKTALVMSAVLLFHNKHSGDSGHHESVQHQIVN